MRIKIMFILTVLFLFGLADQINTDTETACGGEREIYIVCRSECFSRNYPKKRENVETAKKIIFEDEFCAANGGKEANIIVSAEIKQCRQKKRFSAFSKLEKIVHAIKAAESEINLLA